MHQLIEIFLFLVVHSFLIILIALSSVYLIFSVVLLKGIKKVKKYWIISTKILKIQSQFYKNSFQNSRHRIWPWLVWSIIYVLIGIIGAIYELCLGGTILEVTLVPLFYLVLFSLWIYAIWSVFDYFRSLKTSNQSVSQDGNF